MSSVTVHRYLLLRCYVPVCRPCIFTLCLVSHCLSVIASLVGVGIVFMACVSMFSVNFLRYWRAMV
jgi:hypothetical protein